MQGIDSRQRRHHPESHDCPEPARIKLTRVPLDLAVTCSTSMTLRSWKPICWLTRAPLQRDRTQGVASAYGWRIVYLFSIMLATGPRDRARPNRLTGGLSLTELRD